MIHNMKDMFNLIGNSSVTIVKDSFNLLSFVGEISVAIIDTVRHPSKIRWRESLYYMELCGVDCVPIAALICLLMGVILGFQGAIQLHKYGGDIFLADAVGVSIVVELGPLMVAMIATGRAGSAFAADIGTMKVSEEIDAMLTMGFIPSRFLIMPKMLAMIIVMPLLTIVGDLMGIIGGMLVGYFKLSIPLSIYYHRTLIAITPRFLCESLLKSVVFAVLITGIGCMRGFESSGGTQGVGRSATSAVVSGIFLVIIADTLLTILFRMVL